MTSIFLRHSAGALAVLLVAGSLAFHAPAGAQEPASVFTAPLRMPPVLTDEHITLEATEANVQILPTGPPTRMWTFDGSFPGPVIRRPAGELTALTVRNRLPEEAGSITIHNHGNHSASEHDGRTTEEFLIPVGGTRTYEYEPARGAMQWYHDHTHFRTGRNVWMGLAGMFIVEDPAEDARLGLPTGDLDVPLMIADRRFDADNQLTDPFTAPGREDAGPLDALGTGWPPFDEVLGDEHLVNGTLRPYLEVDRGVYRLRVLNASNFRLYNLRLSDGTPLLQIGTESGLLPEPVERDTILLGPAERAEVLVDFSGYDPGDRVELQSVYESRGELPHAGPTPARLMEFRVGTGTGPQMPELPPVLRDLPEWAGDDLGVAPDRVWVFGLNPDEEGRMAWTINGRAFDHHRVDARPEIGSVERWMLVNATGITHYIHIHHTDWLLLSRNGRPPDPWEAGPKETFRLDPGEEIVVAARFTEHLGPFLFHCHMLEHEDHGMMTTFEVVEEGEGDLPLGLPSAFLPVAEPAAAPELFCRLRDRVPA